MRALLLAALCLLLLPSAACAEQSAVLDALVKLAEFDAGDVREEGSEVAGPASVGPSGSGRGWEDFRQLGRKRPDRRSSVP
jgi:hypothetical protein